MAIKNVIILCYEYTRKGKLKIERNIPCGRRGSHLNSNDTGNHETFVEVQLSWILNDGLQQLQHECTVP
jgi:hypothetical protein